MLLVVGALVTTSLALGDDQSASVGVGVVGDDRSELEDAIRKRLSDGITVTMRHFEDVETGEEALRQNSIAALVVNDYEVLWAPETPGWVADSVASAMGEVNLTKGAEDLGLSPADTEQLIRGVAGRTIDHEEGDEAVLLMSVITVIVMFIAILAYGQWIAYAVLEEKANRVAELILGAISPGQLLTAKLISLGGMGLVQLLLLGAVGLLVGGFLTDIAIPDVAASAWIWLILWFMIGYAFYGTLYAASGSLAADSQEAGSVITPLNILPGLGYVFGVIGLSSGAETLVRILSLIPLWAPMVMPGRMAQGGVAWWEVGVAVTLMAVTTAIVMRFSARVYIGGMTQATRQVGWLQAFRGGADLAGTPN